MSAAPRQSLAQTFTELADILVADFDLVEVMHLIAARSQQILDVDAVGILVVDCHGSLNVIAASTEEARVLELSALQNREGPCLECFRTGQPVSCADMSTETTRWPRFAPEALQAGFTGVHALPMRLRDEVIGGMNLFSAARRSVDAEMLDAAQALTNVAAIALIHERAIRHRRLLVEQLQHGINQRLTIEQAKGLIAERAGVGIGEAFDVLRAYACTHHWKLSELAQAVIHDGSTTSDVLRGPAQRN
ncbi:GAF and ANTAR domain-containing protein [Mycolicibacterium iranicum]|uniref:ANTAR domain-containing protein n=1 Tax=Mycolicibacterium iranicum TaxID=912594 RepID=A0A178LYI5_MYCIR|nr:GAF and ANTAR domain-containing protein [Mycolicibacterium iranicum]OAN39878.1 hypothetical protein A4X20_16125 [Mycolicibacterium iranicum]